MDAHTVPEHLQPYWQRVERALEAQLTARFCEAFHFDDNQPSADHLGALVLAGRKRATASLVWAFEFDRKAPPDPGVLSIVTNWNGTPLCVIETLSLATVPFEHVDAEFAAVEGEGDGTLEYWRAAHWDYFGRECARIGRARSATMPVLCERFKVVYSGA